ncbi:hypothetical protein L915_14452 [Phytophthora nicotianae]|uniref:Uncharacterized protein n=1 Tax=Phytophthora nicotianae TaxID=4792 RepID=W2G9V6_PHYNI|nr:hypothetical protein L915_14452 [Phytophthora nicotianae]
MPSISPSILPTASTPVQYRPKFGRIELSRGAQVDVKWFSGILEDGRLTRTSSIPVYGGNGSSGVKNYNTQCGYHPNQHDTRTNSVYSPSTTGKTGGSMNHPEIQLLPSSPRAVICHGIISASSSTLLGCSPVIVSQPQERDEKKELQPKEHPSQSSFCEKFTAVSTSPTSTTASFGGLPAWAGSFFSGDRNILP